MAVGKFSTSTAPQAVLVTAQGEADGIFITAQDGAGVNALTRTQPAILGASLTQVGVGGTSNSNYGVDAESASDNGLFAYSQKVQGVWGEGEGGGVIGVSAGAIGVQGQSTDAAGVHGYSETSDSIVGVKIDSSGVAGNFSNGVMTPAGTILYDAVRVTGNLKVFGNFSVSGMKGFRIDHPLKPKNQWLNHAALESEEMKNFYDGVATLNSRGEAVIRLPKWFEALNESYRYQLTPIGAPGPNLHISQELRDCCFKIAGGSPKAKVSWQLTGVRRDPWAKAHPFQVEEAKSGKESGHAIWPAAKGMAALMSALSPEMRDSLSHAPSSVVKIRKANDARKQRRPKRQKTKSEA